MDRIFGGSLLCSTVIHLSVFIPLITFEAHSKAFERPKQMEIEYSVIQEAEHKFVHESPAISISRPVEVATAPPKQRSEPRKPQVKQAVSKETGNRLIAREETAAREKATAKKISRIKSTKDYVNYFQSIREKIRRELKNGYKDYHGNGDVTLNFIINEDGSLVTVEADNAASVSDNALRGLAVLSVRSAAPFAAFPKAMSIPRMAFNVVISFRKQ